jgi:hypothetical protein
MTVQEERWVSACMFAHTNYFGKHVDLSLRASVPQGLPVLRCGRLRMNSDVFRC